MGSFYLSLLSHSSLAPLSLLSHSSLTPLSLLSCSHSSLTHSSLPPLSLLSHSSLTPLSLPPTPQEKNKQPPFCLISPQSKKNAESISLFSKSARSEKKTQSPSRYFQNQP